MRGTVRWREECWEGVAVIRQWHEWVNREERVGGEGWVGQGLIGQLLVVDEFLYVVLVNVLLHDLQLALQRYMKHAFRGFRGSRTAGAGAWTRGRSQCSSEHQGGR